MLRPILDYALPVMRLTPNQLRRLEQTQRVAVKKIMRVNMHTANEIVEGDTGATKFGNRYDKARAGFAAHVHFLPEDSIVKRVWERNKLARNPARVAAGSAAGDLHAFASPRITAALECIAASREESTRPLEERVTQAIKQGLKEEWECRWREAGRGKRTLKMFYRYKIAPE